MDTGLYETFKPEKQMRVNELLKELNLEGKYFGILINGKKASENDIIKETDEIVILPHIAGGI
ncbi:MAG: MoaD/ThiS family protein [Candidatus Heimdallarchaeota archaeon]